MHGLGRVSMFIKQRTQKGFRQITVNILSINIPKIRATLTQLLNTVAEDYDNISPAVRPGTWKELKNVFPFSLVPSCFYANKHSVLCHAPIFIKTLSHFKVISPLYSYHKTSEGNKLGAT